MLSINEIVEQKKSKFYSIAESRMAFELTVLNAGPFVRQHSIGNYFADFYFPEQNLVLEIDGRQFHTSEEQYKYDRKRDIYMNKLGYIVVRVTAGMVMQNVSGVVSAMRYIKDPVDTFFIKSNEDVKRLMVYYALKNL